MALTYFYLLLAAQTEDEIQRTLADDLDMIEDDPCELFQLPDSQFVAHFRLTKGQFVDLCEEIIPHLQSSKMVVFEEKVMIALAYYAHGGSVNEIGKRLNLKFSRVTLQKCVDEVTDVLNKPEIFNGYIFFPQEKEERKASYERFKKGYGFPSILGAIGNLIVPIMRPKMYVSELYQYGKKTEYGLNVLIICDADQLILHVEEKGGLYSNNLVWQQCKIKNDMETLHNKGEPCWLVGGNSYKPESSILTPASVTTPNTPEWHYNQQLHALTSDTVQRCLLDLKTTWSCIGHKPLRCTPQKAGKLIKACVVLHNFVKDREVELPETGEVNSEVCQIFDKQQIDGRQAVIDMLWKNRNETGAV